MPWTAWRREQKLVRRAGLEPALFRGLSPGLYRLGYTSVGAPGQIRTDTVLVLSQAPPADWATGAKMELPAGFDPAFPPYQSGALPNRRRDRLISAASAWAAPRCVTCGGAPRDRQRSSRVPLDRVYGRANPRSIEYPREPPSPADWSPQSDLNARPPDYGALPLSYEGMLVLAG